MKTGEHPLHLCPPSHCHYATNRRNSSWIFQKDDETEEICRTMLVHQTSWIAWALLKDWRASLLLGRARALSSPVTPCPFFRIQTPCETNQELRRHGRTKPIKKWYWETTVMKIDKRCKLQGTKQKNSHNLLDLGTWLTTGSSRGERGNEREEGREGAPNDASREQNGAFRRQKPH